VWRKTWGWHKKEDEISLSQISLATEMNRSSVVRAIKRLVTKKILSSDNKDTTYANRYRFNKDYDEWKASIKKDTTSDKKVTTSSDNKDNGGVTKKIHTKENYTKETIQKKHSAEGAEVIHLMESIDPKNKTYYGNTTQRICADFLLKEYGMDKIKDVIQIIGKYRGSKGFPSITSPYEMKEKWTKIGEALLRQQNELQPKAKIAFI
jgi:hypothetical protein